MKFLNRLFGKLAVLTISFILFFLCFCLFLCAGIITLNFITLPSAQGWTYESAWGLPESEIFSVSDGILTQNTLDYPWSSECYKLHDVIDPTLPYTISVRARVLAESGYFMHNSFGFGFCSNTGTEEFGIGIGTSRIQDATVTGNVLSTTIDNTQFHDYRLEATPGVGYEFYVDDVLIGTGPPRLLPGSQNLIYFGDLTQGAGAHAEVTRFSFSQGPEIDIKPGSFPNSINPKSKGNIPVAILTTGAFDAATVDVDSVRFGITGTEAEPVQHALEDVDGDGDIDMILHFKTQDTEIECGDTEATLTGETIYHQQITGTDSVRTVGCKEK